jgi:cytochrome c biogenesis protein CcdA
VWPVVLSLAVLILPGRTSSVVDSRDQAPPTGVTLELPATYVVTSPLSRILDTLTLLSNPQSIALLVAVAVIVVAALFATRARSKRRPWVRILIGFAIVLAAVIVLEAMVIFMPRPMGRLEVANPDVVVVDFHTHTLHSRDANQRFTPENRREWHRDGGFDVGYISDHVRFGGAVEAAMRNPRRAGDGVSELSAVEGRYHRIMSTIMLGLTQADTNVLDSKGHLLPGTPASGRTPVTIVALPNRNLDSLTVETLDSVPHFSGIELIDAAPRGLGQLDREEERIRALAAKLRLMLVSASNNHGYGRAAAAWNLMTIPGWRDLSPDSVGRLIERPFHERDLGAVMIVKRLRPRTHGFQVLFTLPVAVWQTLGSLTRTERVVWIAWIWAGWLIVILFRSRKLSDVNSISA